MRPKHQLFNATTALVLAGPGCRSQGKNTSSIWKWGAVGHPESQQHLSPVFQPPITHRWRFPEKPKGFQFLNPLGCQKSTCVRSVGSED